tara:strand:+ start:743 stop:1759 length:1017 start_codon:yes stop_codon:yes gene_type:complete
MKNILYIGNKLSSSGNTIGGIETLGAQFESIGFKVLYAGKYKNKFLRLYDMLSSIFLKRKHFDYVVIDTYSSVAFWYAFFSALLCQIFKKKYIHILRGGSLPSRIKKSQFFSDIMFKKSYLNIAVSNYLYEAFKRYSINTVVIPNNINLRRYNFKKRLKFNPKILWVRSFMYQYNPNMAANVIKELIKDYPNVELCMVGPERDKSLDDFKTYSNDLNVSKNIKITGLLSKEEWHKLSSNYDIFINTTNVDNTPISVIECMALGLPIVSTNVGGIPYLLENNFDSILVSKNDFSSMAFAIKRIIENSDFSKRLCLNARKKVERFDWENVKESWVKILSE